MDVHTAAEALVAIGGKDTNCYEMKSNNTLHPDEQQSRSFAFVCLVSAACTAVLASPPGGYGGHGGGYGASEENYGPPQPYEFSYSAEDHDGSHGHSQTSDGRTVRGHYMIQMADGTKRRVEYHADESGFHAKIVTNELGTESKNPADVVFESSAVTGEQAAAQYGSQHRSRASSHGWN
ncbi:cuticle protein 14-like [Galendromus occidentalis]|uniref:Cuticle protein 14-like n=1 Tax=Galendromus occidentalis TaxID=34638 RepID=A0AAJ7SHZ3_9ACAR|nr:cuticle protein 14-like [Galendromus occidentalis]